MSWNIDPHTTEPPSVQLARGVLASVSSGELLPGDRLPSIRQLAREALVNPNTVLKTYRELEVMGVVRARNGAGVYVAEDGATIARHRCQSESRKGLERSVTAALRDGLSAREVMETVTDLVRQVSRPGEDRE